MQVIKISVVNILHSFALLKSAEVLQLILVRMGPGKGTNERRPFAWLRETQEMVAPLPFCIQGGD